MKDNKKIILFAAPAAVILVLAAAAIYFFLQYQSAQKELASSGNASEKQVQDAVARVGKLVDLPTDETPTLAIVSDKFHLSNQPFFAKAENGDTLLLYVKNKKAILYRPSVNRIINFATDISLVRASPTPAPAENNSPEQVVTTAPGSAHVVQVTVAPTQAAK